MKSIDNLLVMLAPVVMGVIGKVQHKKNLDTTGV